VSRGPLRTCNDCRAGEALIREASASMAPVIVDGGEARPAGARPKTVGRRNVVKEKFLVGKG